MINPTHRTARATLAASLALALALPLASGVAEARSVLGRLLHLVSASPDTEASAGGVANKGASAKEAVTQASDGNGPPAKGAEAEGPTEASAASRWPQELEAAHGQTVAFPHPHAKGRLGDRLTALRLAARGYKKLPSKYDGLHGIDGIYVKRNAAGEIDEIRLVESKVDTSRLNPGPPAQMSDEWIRQVCAKMQAQGTPEAAESARLILAHMDSPKLKRELWHHDLASGKTTVRQVDAGGKPEGVTESWSDKLVANEIERQCSVALLVCN